MAKKIRLWIIGLIGMAGLVLIGGEPTEYENYYTVLIISTLCGFALFGVAALLYKYWDKRGLLPEVDYEDERI